MTLKKLVVFYSDGLPQCVIKTPYHMINSMFNYTAVERTYDLQILDGTIKTVLGNYYAMKESLVNGIPLSPDIAKWLTGSYILPIVFGLPDDGIEMYVTAKRT